MSFSRTDMFDVPDFWRNGPAPGKFHNFPGSTTIANNVFNIDHITHSKTPITTGSSVLGIKFDNGVMIAADTLGSYGSLARFKDVDRTFKVNDNIILGAGGDYGDFQYLKDIIEQKIIDEECLDDGFVLKPKALHCWLTRVLYNRRSKFDPFWNNFIIAGLEDGVPFVGTVDKLGTAYVDDCIATGFGSYLATPLLRNAIDANQGKPLTQEQAHKLIKHCMEVLYYRDCRSYPKFDIATLTVGEGVKIERTEVSQNWEVANMIKGYI